MELPARCVVDGEIVIAGPVGLDFEALLQRIHPADSRVRMPPASTPAATDPALARKWFTVFEGAGLDGVVAKALSGCYSPDKRTMLKVKHAPTADCVVGGFRWHKSGPVVDSLVLGLHDDVGALQHVEVGYDHLQGARFRHTAQLRHFRPDRSPESCRYAQLERPVRFDLAQVLGA